MTATVSVPTTVDSLLAKAKDRTAVFGVVGLGYVGLPLAAEFAIDDIHPNPTEGEVWVSYALPSAGEATLDLIDVAGRRVATLTLQGPGASRVLLTRGGDLAAGIYVVRLSQQGRSVTRRVSIVR